MNETNLFESFRRLQPDELRATCDASTLSFETTAELEPLEGIIGQKRALESIRFGLGIRSFGYNLYVAGSPGTGKKTLIRSLVEEIARGAPTPDDILYVHNFARPERPRALTVPPGLANTLHDDMEDLVDTLREELPKAFTSEDYELRKNQLVHEFQEKRSELLERVQREAKSRSLVVKSSGPQVLTLPAVDGREISPEEYEELTSEQRESIQQNQKELSETLQEVYREIRGLQEETQENMKGLDRRVALIAAGHYLDTLRIDYREYPGILQYLDEVQNDIVHNLSDFLPREESEDSGPQTEDDPLKRYRINVIVDNSDQKGAPVVQETHPTYRNLIGYAEREVRMGTLYTDFTMIRAGSVLTANRGFLILDLVDLLATPLAWDALKRVLQDRAVAIQDASEQYGMSATLGLRPEPVEVDLKVVVLGSSELYALLYRIDESFQKLFKIRAEFDTVTRIEEGHLDQYPRFVRTLCEKESLRHFNRDAVAALIEHSSRMVSDKTRLTLRFSDVADLIREASHWAGQSGQDIVKRSHVMQAIEAKAFRSNLFEEKVQEQIDEGAIMISTEGSEVGQINGLAVFQVGDYAFGKPTRITAQVGIGDKGIINIEREARMSGAIHDKGVLILGGYLHGKYGQSFPLSLRASVCFEQSYSGVDGDSASSTELYSILSSLAGVPIRQSLAVTGSVNQLGMIQPIGGVNEKIEGYFATCRAVGLTGEQGVLIPHQNVQNLMLKAEVIEAVREGRFHIFPVRTIDEGIEILTGMPAGEPQPDGSYPEGTVHARVRQRLAEMAEIVRRQSESRKSTV